MIKSDLFTTKLLVLDMRPLLSPTSCIGAAPARARGLVVGCRLAAADLHAGAAGEIGALFVWLIRHQPVVLFS
jgi:hypothetical protein